jgi:hypothetical protein
VERFKDLPDEIVEHSEVRVEGGDTLLDKKPEM